MDFVPLFYLFVHLRLYSQLIFEYSRKPFQSKKYSQMWKRATPGKWAGAFMNLCFALKSSYPYTFPKHTPATMKQIEIYLLAELDLLLYYFVRTEKIHAME